MHERKYKHPRLHWIITICIGLGIGITCLEILGNLGKELKNYQN